MTSTTAASTVRPQRAVTAGKAAHSGARPTLVRRGAVNLVLLLIASCYLVPLLWLVLAAFNSTAGPAVTWPDRWTFDNFRAVLTPEITFRPMLNGLILCGGATIVTMVCAVLAAYPLSRYRSRMKRPFLLTVLFMTGLPITAIMVPVYGLFVQVDLIDTFTGTILFMATTALPISIWLSKNFMDAVPIELEEAAWTDGASPMQALRRIVLPLMWPGIAVVALYTFIGLWGNFFVPFVLLLSNDNLPASVSIYTFFSQYAQVVYGQLAAYSMLYSLPAVLLYLILSRRLSGAFTFGGAVKG
ncbi:MAG: multiple sugar transport system permease protein [Pseudonocardiales bacterium]|jgi:multiple sugar transport system permease protein|nr:binding-protein-dependent transport system inner rane component [Pseudonocardia sp.]MDT7650331.1 multiple sugar transport system permease protein [Pseudonocardiales bacterium]